MTVGRGTTESEYEQRIRELESRLEAMGETETKLTEMVGHLERDLRGKRLRISQLEAQIAKSESEDEHAEEALEVFHFWKALISPRARAFAGDRRTKVLARLKELDPGESVHHRKEVLKDAIRGAHVGAYIDDKGVRHDGLELICRSDEHVLKFVKRWEAHQAAEAKKAGKLMKAWRDEWFTEERLTVDSHGNLAPATPGPISELDKRSPAQRAFDAVILRHVFEVSRLEVPTSEEQQMADEAQQRIESMNGVDFGPSVMREAA